MLRSQSVDNPTLNSTVLENCAPASKRSRGSTSEFTSISSIFSNDFLRSRTHKYGKLLVSRDSTCESGSVKLRPASASSRPAAVRIGITSRDTGEASEPLTDENGGLLDVARKGPEKDDNNSQEDGPYVDNHSRRKSAYVLPQLQESNKAATARRIVRRKTLFTRRRKMCNVCVGLAVMGMLVMMVDMEITRWNLPNSANQWTYYWCSLLLKLMVVMTTVGLVFSIVAYHAIEIQIFLMESGAEDWRVAMTARRVVPLIMEVIICAICPLPDLVLRSMPSCNTNGGLIYQSQVPLNVLLSIPMFARSYLVCRIMVLHSKQFQDTTIWSIASFNQVTVNFKFVAKTLLSDHPLKVLVVSTVTACCCAAWMFTQCERYSYMCEAEPCSSYFDSLWLVIITLFGIGYGDIVPHTYCGRFVAVWVGIAGMGVSAAVISVMTGKIGLTRSEKQVNSFVTDSKLATGLRHAAATILQETWLIHKHKNHHSLASKLRVVRHQRKFLQAIARFRNVKMAQRGLKDKQFEFIDVRKVQHDVQETVLEMQKDQSQILTHVDTLSRHFTEIQNSVKAELQESVMDIQQNQHYMLQEMSLLQKNMGAMQMHLGFMVNQLKEIGGFPRPENMEKDKTNKEIKTSRLRPRLAKTPSLSTIGRTITYMPSLEEDDQ